MKSITLTQRSGGLLIAAMTTAFAVILMTGFGMTAQAADAEEVLNLNTGATSTSIQMMIDDASTTDGDLIEVGDGVYTENIMMTKELTLKADTQHQATIVGSITIYANNVTVDGFVIDGNESLSTGIDVPGFTGFNGNLAIYGNDIKNFTGAGILLGFDDPGNSEAVTIRWNYIHQNGIGISILESVGDAAIEIADNGIKFNDSAIDNNGENVVFARNDIDNGVVTINVMKHICNPSIQSTQDFNDTAGNLSFDNADDEMTSFLNKLLACPTVVLEDDDYTDGISFEEKRDFDFTVTGDQGETQTISSSTFMPQKVCETDLGIDVNGDGEISADTCVDTSMYVYSNVSSGNVVVTETVSPTGDIGGFLEFTPAALNDGFDEEITLNDANRFEDGFVVINSDLDEGDDTITLHLYNMQVEVDDSDDDSDEVTSSPSNGGGSGGDLLAPRSSQGSVAGASDRNNDRDDRDDRDTRSDRDDHENDRNGQVIGAQDDTDVWTDAEMSLKLRQMTMQLQGLLGILQSQQSQQGSVLGQSVGFPNTGDGSDGNSTLGQ